MTSDERAAVSGAGGPRPEEAALEAEIERTREDLAETVHRVAARLDVTTRLRQRAASVNDGAAIGAGALAVAAAVLVAVGVRRWRGRR